MIKLTESLNGRRVVGLFVNQNEEALRFWTDGDEDVIWRTDGDCCSESWWADALQVNALRGATVKSVEELEPESARLRTRQESDQVYGFRITTDKGVTTVVFRNSSNGYYGGWAYLGVPQRYGRPVSSPADNWREIEGNDWQA